MSMTYSSGDLPPTLTLCIANNEQFYFKNYFNMKLESGYCKRQIIE